MSTGSIIGLNEKFAGAAQGASATFKSSPVLEDWDPEKFGREQIRGMVRRILLQKIGPPARQVMFSAADPGINIDELCLQVAQVLAKEQRGGVALLHHNAPSVAAQRCVRLKENAIALESNLWSLPGYEHSRSSGALAGLYGYLAAARAEFEYSILVGPPAEDESAVLQAAQFSDGLVLVLSVHTRRAAALHIKRVLDQAGVRILGAVLTDREFPIPQRLYRCL